MDWEFDELFESDYGEFDQPFTDPYQLAGFLLNEENYASFYQRFREGIRDGKRGLHFCHQIMFMHDIQLALAGVNDQLERMGFVMEVVDAAHELYRGSEAVA